MPGPSHPWRCGNICRSVLKFGLDSLTCLAAMFYVVPAHRDFCEKCISAMMPTGRPLSEALREWNNIVTELSRKP